MDLGAFSPATQAAAEVIRALALAPLPREGGHFRRTYESAARVPGSDRRACSAILYLVTPESFSALHAVDADETWCFHAGDALDLLHLRPAGGGGVVALGPGGAWQHTVPAGDWQGARLRAGGRWALVSCVVAPEYRDEGFTLGDRDALAAAFPAWADAVARFTRAAGDDSAAGGRSA